MLWLFGCSYQGLEVLKQVAVLVSQCRASAGGNAGGGGGTAGGRALA
jgi:hypothetical protein